MTGCERGQRVGDAAQVDHDSLHAVVMDLIAAIMKTATILRRLEAMFLASHSAKLSECFDDVEHGNLLVQLIADGAAGASLPTASLVWR
jgi:hypothetical protein